MILNAQFIPVDHETVTVPGSGTVAPTRNTPRKVCMGIYVGGAGNVVCTLASNGDDGQVAATYAAVQGQTIIGQIASVDHSSTATSLVFLYLPRV